MHKSLQMSDVMTSVTNLLNIIREGNRAQRHRKFIQLLNDLEPDCKDVSLFSRIRWLSAGKTLKHLSCLRKETFYFLQSETEESAKEYHTQLSDGNFTGSLTLLTDISNHLNILNMKLQGKKMSLNCLDTSKVFTRNFYF